MGLENVRNMVVDDLDAILLENYHRIRADKFHETQLLCNQLRAISADSWQQYQA